MAGQGVREELLRVEGLRVSFGEPERPLWAVDGVEFHVRRGERVAIVGESGSGKSVTALAISRLIEYQGGHIDRASRIVFGGADLLSLDREDLRAIRGRRIGMVFQDHQSSFNPIQRVRDQIGEALLVHGMVATRDEAHARAVELMSRVGFRRPERAATRYPHELSGGMRQRAMIAMALAGEPDLLIADEPTTALDAVIQRQILELLRELSEAMNLSVVLISHDLELVAAFADRVYVMYAGKIVETGAAADLFASPQHQYTRGLLDSRPSTHHRRSASLRVIPGAAPGLAARPSGCPFHVRCAYNDGERCVKHPPALELTAPGGHEVACYYPGERAGRPESVATRPARAPALVAAPDSNGQTAADREGDELLRVTGLVHSFSRARRLGRASDADQPAVDDVSFVIRRGQAFGLVGESGSGKSTVARCVTRLIRPTAGRIEFEGRSVLDLNNRTMRTMRQRMQMVFQDPRATLDPLMRAETLLQEPLRIFHLWGKPGYDRARLVEMIELVGLSERDLQKYPHEFSGGQLQRIAIAMALALSPDLLICDEVTASLDASIAAQIINLLDSLQRHLGLTYLFITHDLSLVRYFCDYVAVMDSGRIVEAADCASLFSNPQHDYTKALLNARSGAVVAATQSA